MLRQSSGFCLFKHSYLWETEPNLSQFLNPPRIIIPSFRSKKKSVSVASKYKSVNIDSGFSPIIYCKFSQKTEINCQLLPRTQGWYQAYIFLVHWVRRRLNLTQALSFSKKHLTLLMNGHTFSSCHCTKSSNLWCKIQQIHTSICIYFVA